MSRTIPTRRARGRLAFIGTVFAIALVGAACLSPPPAGWVNPSGSIINHHNYARSQAGLPGFVTDGNMNGLAEYHAKRLATGAGNSCSIWHSGELGSWYAGHSAGENVACWPGCPADGGGIVGMWLNSPGHRANIMNGGFRFIGVGAYCSWGRTFAVAHYRN